MGNTFIKRKTMKVHPCRTPPARFAPGWVEIITHDGCTVLYHAEKGEYNSLDRGTWYTQSRKERNEHERRTLFRMPSDNSVSAYDRVL